MDVRTAIGTGTASGIGALVVTRMRSHGARVVATRIATQRLTITSTTRAW